MKADFHSDLAWSHNLENNPIWGTIYRKAFPQIVKIVSYRNDMEKQFKGVDRGIILRTGKEIFVDEKGRRRAKNGAIYRDVLLEFVSNDKTKTPGWVCKDLLADYIAYFITPIGICYMLPVIQLQNAWQLRKEEWLNMFGQRIAKNKGYSTINCPVPIDTLFPAMGGCLRVKVKSFE